MEELRINYFLGAYEDTVLQALAHLKKERIIARIRAKDYTVWKSTPDKISNRLGWLDAPADALKQLSYVHSVIDPVITAGYKNAVLLGMGGSSLAAEVFNEIFGSHDGHPTLHILDTTDPAAIARISQELNLPETIFLVSSKSGTTLETVSLFHYFYNLALKKLGKRAGRNFIIITDPGSPLEELVDRLSLRHVFLNNPAIGGRYSALSFPGIVPAVLLGIDADCLLRNVLPIARQKEAESFKGKLNSSGSVLGTVLGTLAQQGLNKLTFISSPSWTSLGNWLEQLIAESTGKEGKGILPVCAEPLHVPAAYNNDRLFVIYHSKEQANTSKVSALIAAGHPVITVQLQNKFHLARQMFLWEMATAVAGHVMGINPFDQPDVEATKVITRRIIDFYRKKKELPHKNTLPATPGGNVDDYTSASVTREALGNFLAGATHDAYVCLQVYLTSTPEINAVLRRLRAAISKKYRLAVTIGYGPRYLHSTGQLHKGDAGQGLFIQLTSRDLQDIEIPDRFGTSASTLTFGALKSAQAAGDRQALIELGRKVIHFHLGKNIIADITALTRSLAGKRLSRNVFANECNE